MIDFNAVNQAIGRETSSPIAGLINTKYGEEARRDKTFERHRIQRVIDRELSDMRRQQRTFEMIDYGHEAGFQAGQRERAARLSHKLNEQKQLAKQQRKLNVPLQKQAVTHARDVSRARSLGSAQGQIKGENLRRSNLSAWDAQDDDRRDKLNLREIARHDVAHQARMTRDTAHAAGIIDAKTDATIRGHWDQVQSGMKQPFPGAIVPATYTPPLGMPYSGPTARPSRGGSRTAGQPTQAQQPTAAPAGRPSNVPPQPQPGPKSTGRASRTRPPSVPVSPPGSAPTTPTPTAQAQWSTPGAWQQTNPQPTSAPQPSKAQQPTSMTHGSAKVWPPQPTTAAAPDPATPGPAQTTRAARQSPLRTGAQKPATHPSLIPDNAAAPQPTPTGRSPKIRMGLPRKPGVVRIEPEVEHEHVSGRFPWATHSFRTENPLPGQRVESREESSGRLRARGVAPKSKS